jgi:hypothetical protein
MGCPWPRGSPRWWPGEVPVRRQRMSPLVASEGPHLALQVIGVPCPTGEGVVAETHRHQPGGQGHRRRRGEVGHHHRVRGDGELPGGCGAVRHDPRDGQPGQTRPMTTSRRSSGSTPPRTSCSSVHPAPASPTCSSRSATPRSTPAVVSATSPQLNSSSGSSPGSADNTVGKTIDTLLRHHYLVIDDQRGLLEMAVDTWAWCETPVASLIGCRCHDRRARDVYPGSDARG